MVVEFPLLDGACGIRLCEVVEAARVTERRDE